MKQALLGIVVAIGSVGAVLCMLAISAGLIGFWLGIAYKAFEYVMKS